MENNTSPVRVLNFVPNLRAAGIETFIMNVYRNIDKKKVQFDFIVHSEKKEFYDDEVEKMGGKIYRFSYKDDKNIIKYIKDINSFFKTHKEYKIVHGHMQSMMPLYLYIAKKNNVPIRIAHAHNGNFEKSPKGFILHIFSRFSKFMSTENYACSEIAGKYLFGNKKFDIIYNGIDTNNFLFDLNVRNIKREELGMQNNFVLTHVGRFELQKNHKFLIKLFLEYSKINENARLLLIGEGRFEKDIKKYVNKNGIDKKVFFLGVRNDINEIMQASDVFLLPSLYEGLPVVGIESQVSGLNCLFSDTITKEVKFSENTYFLNNKKINDWIKYLEKLSKITYGRKRYNNEEIKKFDIYNISKEIENRYLNY